jgi:monoamine oxidase
VPGNYRLKGGTQMMTDAFACRLGDRVRLGCPVTGIEHGKSGVAVCYREFGEAKKMDADYLVCCMSAPMLSQLAVTPQFSAAKAYAIRNVAYCTAAHVAFQCRRPFWEKDKLPPSLEFGERNLGEVWRIAEELATHRALLEGSAEPGTTSEEALGVFRKLYPGKSEDIEQAFIYDWSQDPWCTFCETVTLPPGQLPKVWPRIIKPEGRIHFAGAYADNMSWGMEAATRSANRAAKAIDEA